MMFFYLDLCPVYIQWGLLGNFKVKFIGFKMTSPHAELNLCVTEEQNSKILFRSFDICENI